VSIDVPSTSPLSVGCATAAFAGALTTDRVLATPLTMQTDFAFASARISAGGFVEVCLTNVSIEVAHDPAAIDVFVMDYIP
jgi:hypothetical protein